MIWGNSPPVFKAKTPREKMCKLAQQLSRDVMRNQTRANNYGWLMYEEAITQSIMIALNEKLPSSVLNLNRKVLDTFTGKRMPESQSGADWVMTVNYGSSSLDFLIQAKRMSENGQYSSVDKTIGKPGPYQVDELVKTAGRLNVIPAYCFFNFDFHGLLQHDHDYALRGCTIAWGKQIQKLVAKKTFKFADCDNIAFPWHRLFCCKSRILSVGYHGISSTMSNYTHRLMRLKDEEQSFHLTDGIENLKHEFWTQMDQLFAKTNFNVSTYTYVDLSND
ncbi:DUF6615 family protein [Curvivirga sp.]|uniref:DUF6615 family protein n=1 Tax=Curvivirga sp. TaxID=2856848 RepID=UPI003B5C1683